MESCQTTRVPVRSSAATRRERAVRMAADTIAEQGDPHGAVTRVARELGIGTEPKSCSTSS